MPAFDPSDKCLQQRRRILLLPNQIEWEPNVHIDDRQQRNASGALPSCGFRDPGDSNLALDQTQDGISICGLLNDARGAQATASTHVHQLIVDSGIDPAMKPDERLIPKISQPNAFSLRQRMTFGHGEDHPVQCELPVLELLVPGRDRGGKPGVQSIGNNGFNLVNRHHVMKHEFHVWMAPSEFAKHIHDRAMPGHRRGDADSKRTGSAKGHPFGASPRLVDVLQDASRVAQEQFPRRAQSNATRQSVEQEKSDLLLQILDLPRQRRLRDMQPRRRATEVLFLSDPDEIAQMS